MQKLRAEKILFFNYKNMEYIPPTTTTAIIYEWTTEDNNKAGYDKDFLDFMHSIEEWQE